MTPLQKLSGEVVSSSGCRRQFHGFRADHVCLRRPQKCRAVRACLHARCLASTSLIPPPTVRNVHSPSSSLQPCVAQTAVRKGPVLRKETPARSSGPHSRNPLLRLRMKPPSCESVSATSFALLPFCRPADRSKFLVFIRASRRTAALDSRSGQAARNPPRGGKGGISPASRGFAMTEEPVRQRPVTHCKYSKPSGQQVSSTPSACRLVARKKKSNTPPGYRSGGPWRPPVAPRRQP